MTKDQKRVYEAAMRWYRDHRRKGGPPYFDPYGRATHPLHKLYRACTGTQNSGRVLKIQP